MLWYENNPVPKYESCRITVGYDRGQKGPIWTFAMYFGLNEYLIICACQIYSDMNHICNHI